MLYHIHALWTTLWGVGLCAKSTRSVTFNFMSPDAIHGHFQACTMLLQTPVQANWLLGNSTQHTVHRRSKQKRGSTECLIQCVTSCHYLFALHASLLTSLWCYFQAALSHTVHVIVLCMIMQRRPLSASHLIVPELAFNALTPQDNTPSPLPTNAFTPIPTAARVPPAQKG